MDISIVTAVFNREKSIARALASVAAQSWPHTEHLVIDGASRDRTCEIVRTHAGPNVSLVSEPDAGIYDAINKGLRLARGDIIGVLHSDDLFAHPDVLRMVAAHFEDPALDAVYADAAFFSSHEPGKLIRRYNSGRFVPSRIQYGWMPAHTTLFLRRSVFDRFGHYKTNYRIAADFEFIARIFKDGALKAHYVPEIWVHMQTGGASTAGFSSTLTIARESLRACRENGISSNYLKILSKYPFKLLEYQRT
tara:strand:+ start:4025 stop:4774 length:750 start_codon:yes stop_codon:yes gene_type:complete